ncbi:nucleotidyltransferase domain-containing protein [Candidatus Poribacteria bacterium]|nr:nucleotidyltransferase domain-containing protein [Candidatus Poribacteria bacterium]
MNKDQLILNLKNFFEKKFKNYYIDMVFLYGSWARGYPQNESDVDLALFFSTEPANDDEMYRIITDISFEISEEINKEVNIIPLYDDFRKPMLYYNAIILGIPIYINNFERYVYLKNQAIIQMEDFNIFGTKWQLEVSRKNFEVLKHG